MKKKPFSFSAEVGQATSNENHHPPGFLKSRLLKKSLRFLLGFLPLPSYRSASAAVEKPTPSPKNSITESRAWESIFYNYGSHSTSAQPFPPPPLAEVNRTIQIVGQAGLNFRGHRSGKGSAVDVHTRHLRLLHKSIIIIIRSSRTHQSRAHHL